jgi:hypothetical protein
MYRDPGRLKLRVRRGERDTDDRPDDDSEEEDDGD